MQTAVRSMAFRSIRTTRSGTIVSVGVFLVLFAVVVFFVPTFGGLFLGLLISSPPTHC